MTHKLVARLESGNPLTEQELETFFDEMFRGFLDSQDIEKFLLALVEQGERSIELSVGARLMRDRASKVNIPDDLRPLIDNCGTGGDGSNSFNISTAAAIVAASCGAKVAKHGNRSVSSKCGSADLLFAAGLPDAMTPEQSAKLLTKTGFTFFFAPNFHPALKHVMPTRRKLKIRTIFNLLGPLANPIAPEFQIIGVADKKYILPMAEALAGLNAKRGLVVHSRDGLDEISPSAITDGALIENGRIEEFSLDPKNYGIKGALADLAGGDAKFNLNLLARFLEGHQNTLSQTVCLNAAAAMWITGTHTSIDSAFTQCKNAVTSGKTKKYFENWIAIASSIVSNRG